MPILSTEEKKIKRIEGAVSTTVLKEQPGRTSMSEGQSRLAIIDGNVTDVKKVGDELFQKRIFKSFDEEARTILNTEDEITVRHKFTGEPIFDPGFQSESFSSGFAGSGYRINKETASEFSSPNTAYNIEIDNMIVRGTLSVYELLIQQIRATNGAIFVTSAAKVASASGLSASDDDGTITFDDPSGKSLCPFADGDIIMMQRVDPGATVAQSAAGNASGVVKKLVYKVNGAPSGATITVENGGFNNLSYPVEGDEFVRIGNDGTTSNRDGVIYLTSDDSNAPYIDIKSDIDTYAKWYGNVPKVRLGNLAGITYDSASLSGFGLYSENVYLTGKMTATSGYIGNGSSGFTINSAYIGNGKTSLTDSSSGVYVGTDGISLGASSVFKVTSAGAVTAASGTIGGWTVDSNSLFSGTKDVSGYTASNGDITITSAGGIHTPMFYVDSSGNAAFKGTLTIGSTNLDATNTLNENTTKANVGLSNVDNDSTSTIRSGTTKANVGLGNVDNDSTSTIRSVAAATSGTVGPITVSPSGGAGGGAALYQGTGAYNNTNTGFYMDSAGNFSLKDKLAFNGSVLTINGGGTFSGALSAASGTFGGALSGGTISIGSSNSIFKADSNGIYLGNATFGSAPFRVTPAGAVTAESITITSGDYLNIESGGDAYFSSDRVKFTKDGSVSLVGNASGTVGLIFYPGTDSPSAGSHTGNSWKVFQDSNNDLGHMYSSTVSMYWRDDGSVEMSSGNYFYLGIGSDADTGFQRNSGHLECKINDGGTSHSFRPTTNGTQDLGGASNKWENVYASNGTIVTSDATEKESIEDSSLGLDFVDKLKPVSYKWIGKTRKHYGLTSQQVKEVMDELSISTTDFAGYIAPEDASQGLRYHEFIAPMIKAIQELKAEVEELKSNG